MRIALLGGSGFVGSRLVSRLVEHGHRVRIFDKAPSPVHPALVTLGDVRDGEAVARVVAGCDCVINLAGEHRDDVKPVSRYFEVHVGGAEKLVRAAEAHAIKHIVFVSSVAVYGLNQLLPDETAAIRPSNEYGRSKAEAETVYAKWAAADPVRRSLTLVRPAVAFGEGGRGNVFNLIEQIRRGRFLMVGSGKNFKSVAYVENLVDFICAQIGAEPGVRVFNYADKPDLTTMELVREIRALLPRAGPRLIRLPYSVGMAAGYMFDALAWISGRPQAISSARVRKFCADTRVATVALERSGFRPRFTVHDGLAQTVATILAGDPRRAERESPGDEQ